MNIFITDPCPTLSAIALDNRRLVKMVLETAQLLSTACRMMLVDEAVGFDGLYRKTHFNHPYSIVTRHKDRRTYAWRMPCVWWRERQVQQLVHPVSVAPAALHVQDYPLPCSEWREAMRTMEENVAEWAHNIIALTDDQSRDVVPIMADIRHAADEILLALETGDID